LNLFKSKQSSSGAQQPQFQTLYDPFATTRAKTNEWLTSQVGQPGPSYTGERVAPASDVEQAGIDYAKSYAQQPSTGDSFKAAQGEIQKTLSGDYDPSTSPYYQAVKAEASRNLGVQNKQIADNAAGGGMYYSGARLKAQADASQKTTQALDTTLAGLAEKERQNRLAAVPLALQADQYGTNADAKKAQVLQVLGALPRELQQALLDATYQQWNQANYDYPLNIAQISAGLSAQQPTFVQSGYQPYQQSTGAGLLSLLNL